MTAAAPATVSLAEFAAGARPPQVQLDSAARTLAAALAAGRDRARSAAVESALGAAAVYETEPRAGLIGRSERLAPTWAALVNGVSSNAAVVAAALAIGDDRDLTVGEVSTAIAIGLEAGHRIESSLAGAEGRRAWAAGAAGAAIGAATAAGRLAGLTVPQLTFAIALAATQAGGIGGDGSGLTAGRAAFNAVEASALAAAGFTGPPTAIEGRRGLSALTAPGASMETLLDRLGEVWATAGEPAGGLLGLGAGRRVRELLGRQ